MILSNWKSLSVVGGEPLAFMMAESKHEFVRYQGFIVEKRTSVMRNPSKDHGLRKPDETIVGFCYYFNKLGD